jgi:death-on-curing protein
MYVVTADNIKDIHEEVIAESGGVPGVLSTGTLDHIAFECNIRNDVFVRAAVALHGVITMHTFFDGNKRTGFITADVILRSQGYEIQADEKDIIDFLLQVASYRVDVKGVEEWFRKNTVRA